MNDDKTKTMDSSNAVVHPPIAWALAFVAGHGADWLYPWRFIPVSFPAAWLGGARKFGDAYLDYKSRVGRWL